MHIIQPTLALFLVCALLPSSNAQSPAPNPIDKKRGDDKSTPIEATATITQCGSYVLTACLNTDEIFVVVDADDVTLDLNGFSLRGSETAIVVVGEHKNIVIRNGFLCTQKAAIIAPEMNQSQLIDLTVTNKDAQPFTEPFIEVGNQVSVAGCSFLSESALTLKMGSQASLRNSTIANADGTHALMVAAHSSVQGCTLLGNLDCSAEAMVRGCTIKTSSSNGVECQDSCTVLDCNVVTGPFASGIIAEDNCLIRGNEVNAYSSGIVVSGSKNRIEANNVVCARSGILVTGSYNIILKNSTRCNVGFSIAHDNTYGPVLDVKGSGDLSQIPNGDHPWANFEY